MKKCICIKDYQKDGKPVFTINNAYPYEFVPALGAAGQTYHVMIDDMRFEVLNHIRFREHFKK